MEDQAIMAEPNDEKPLTHEEIWDDSSLVRSWDDAVEEYQLYHSIHAKGENVEDVLRKAEENGILNGENPASEEPDVEDVAMTGEEEDSSAPFPDADSDDPTSQGSSVADEEPSAEEPTDTATQGLKPLTGAMPMPEPILAQVQDESLKQLMMSWYYAGYYTGLYEGQQQAKSSKS